MKVLLLSEADPKDKLIIERLKEDHGKLLSSFCCVSDDENEFLKKDALGHQRLRLNQTYLLFREDREKILSYITLTIGSIALSPDKEFYGVKIKEKPYELPRNIPCMLVGRIATDKTEVNKGYATYMISFARLEAIKKSEMMPFPIMALHSYPHAVDFYTSLGFEKAYEPSENKPKTIPMFLPLFEEVLG
jgi:hypothetical protein